MRMEKSVEKKWFEWIFVKEWEKECQWFNDRDRFVVWIVCVRLYDNAIKYQTTLITDVVFIVEHI